MLQPDAFDSDAHTPTARHKANRTETGCHRQRRKVRPLPDTKQAVLKRMPSTATQNAPTDQKRRTEALDSDAACALCPAQGQLCRKVDDSDAMCALCPSQSSAMALQPLQRTHPEHNQSTAILAPTATLHRRLSTAHAQPRSRALGPNAHGAATGAR